MTTGPEAVFSWLEAREADWIALRREFHAQPELLYDVDRTAARIAGLLESCGLVVERGVGRHFGKGVIGVLEGARSGKTLLVRADMDALPIREQNEVVYRSTIDGVMHACGHDAHITMLLAAAMALSRFREQLAGTVKFVFQPAEEGAAPSPLDGELRSGGRDLVESGVADNISAAFAFHVWPGLPVGEAAVHRNRALAASSHFRFTFHGTSGHHGAPHLAADALMMVTQFVMDAKAAFTSAVNPLEPAVLAFGTIQAGTVINAIAGESEAAGTFRAFEPGTVKRIKELLEQCAEEAARRHGGSCEASFRMGKALINEPRAVETAVRAASRLLGEQHVTILDTPSLAGEDFAYYLDKAPGAMLLIGVEDPEQEDHYPLHHSRFNLDERALLIGAKLHVQLAYELLNGSA